MSIIKDHGLRSILESKDLRNDPEVISLVCDVIESFDDDIDKVGGILVSRKTDNKLEKLAEAVTRVEDESNQDEDEDEDEDEIDEFDDEDEEDEDEELDDEFDEL